MNAAIPVVDAVLGGLRIAASRPMLEERCPPDWTALRGYGTLKIFLIDPVRSEV